MEQAGHRPREANNNNNNKQKEWRERERERDDVHEKQQAAAAAAAAPAASARLTNYVEKKLLSYFGGCCSLTLLAEQLFVLLLCHDGKVVPSLDVNEDLG